jgi:cobalt-zinc-cadmium resistance protein CzcA
MALASGIGADVQKPLAIVVVGGIGLVPIFVLVVLPALIDLIARPSEQEEEALAAEGLAARNGAAE